MGEEKRRKKGKGVKKSGGSRRKVAEEEDPEELARVSSRSCLEHHGNSADTRLLSGPQLKAERLERQRDDPYYVGSTAPAPSATSDDVDSIPIVQLDLNFVHPSSAQRPPTPPPREPTPPPVHVDVDGEMPDGFELAPPVVESKVESEREEEPSEVVVESKAQEGAVTKVVKKKRKEPSAGKKKKTSSKAVVEA